MDWDLIIIIIFFRTLWRYYSNQRFVYHSLNRWNWNWRIAKKRVPLRPVLWLNRTASRCSVDPTLPSAPSSTKPWKIQFVIFSFIFYTNQIFKKRRNILNLSRLINLDEESSSSQFHPGRSLFYVARLRDLGTARLPAVKGCIAASTRIHSVWLQLSLKTLCSTEIFWFFSDLFFVYSFFWWGFLWWICFAFALPCFTIKFFIGIIKLFKMWI